MTDPKDKILQFPGSAIPGGADITAPSPKTPSSKASGAKADRKAKSASTGSLGLRQDPGLFDQAEELLKGMDEDRRKALGLILSGTAFVMVGIKPTERGADFFTALAGESADLRNALPHLTAVIERALERRGW